MAPTLRTDGKTAIRYALRRSPRLYSAVHRIRFIFSPTRCVGKMLYGIQYRDHRRNTQVIAGPNHLGYAGGIYNPGALPLADRFILLAKGQLCHWWDAVGTKADLYYQGDPVMFELDRNMALISSRPVKRMERFPATGRVGYEDFRLFDVQGETWVNHSMIPLVRKHACSWTFREAKPCLSRFDPEGAQLTFLGHPRLDFEPKLVEKNWIYLEHGGELYLFYSFAPYRVLRLIDRDTLSFTTVIDESLKARFANVGGFDTYVSFSTNPIEYDRENLLLLIHQVERKHGERFYHHWGVLIQKSDLMPRKVTRQPLFVGMGARGRRPGIVYVSAVVRSGEDFVFFMGEGDAYVTRASLPRQSLEPLWTDLSSALRDSGRQ